MARASPMTRCRPLAKMYNLCDLYNLCKVSGVSGVWVEEASPGGIQCAMTDGLIEVVGVSYELLLSDSVDADPDHSLSMGRVSSNGLTPGLVGKISAEAITLRKVTSEFTDSSCIIAWVSSWVSETLLIVFKA